MPQTSAKHDVQSPRISIITVCKNDRDALIDTIESVRAQRYSRIEYIIIDGASTDGTQDIIKQNQDVVSTFISEPDSGIFEAMNKGAKLATGDFLLFLNAGDTLIRPETIDALVDAVQRSQGADIYHGDILLFDPATGKSIYHSAKKASRVSLYRGAMSHQAMLISRSAFERVGPYEQSFLIGGDYEWSLRALHKLGVLFCAVPICVSVFKLGGLSTKSQHQQTMHDEFNLCRDRYYSRIDKLKIRTIVRFHKIFGI